MLWEQLNLSEGSCAVFSYLLKHNPAAKSDICRDTGKGVSTVTRYLLELCDAGLIVEHGIGDSSGGRKPVLYTINSSRFFICCINVSTIYCEVAVVNMSMDVLKMDRFPIHADDTPCEVVEKITSVFKQQQDALNLDSSCFLGAGISVFSSVRNEQGVLYRPLIRYMNHLWEDYPLISELKSRLNLPLYVEKGINAAAMLESNYGKARDSEKSIYVLCAMNIRAAVIQNGQITCSSPFYEDAFGHMTIDYDGPLCPCGRYGCVNCYANIPAVLNGFRKLVKRSGCHSELYDRIDDLTIYELCRAAEDGDSLAVRAIEDSADMLGIALANFINLIGPDTVILDGLLPHESRLYYRRAVEAAKKRLVNAGSHSISFEREGRFSNSITIGAAAMLLERIVRGEPAMTIC